MTESPPRPTYDLDTIKELVGIGHYRVTSEALNCLGELGFDRTDVVQCIQALSPESFHKTMASITAPGLWQDVYRPVHCGIPLYVKLQLVQRAAPNCIAVVVSFKRK